MNQDFSINQKLVIIFISLLATVSGAVYLLFNLSSFGIWLTLGIVLVLFWLIKKRFDLKWQKPTLTLPAKKDLLWLSALVLSWGACLALLILARTGDSIVTPWARLPWYFFAFYLISSSLIIRASLLGAWQWRLLVKLHYLLSFSIAVVVYKVGFGFDPFIHQAAISHIAEHGAITPKTIYYASQYGLEIIIHYFTSLPISLIDKLLVPVTAAWLLPAALEIASEKMFHHEQIARTTSLLFLFIGFSEFIITTPQNLAYVLIIIAVLLAIAARKQEDWLIVFLLTTAAMLAQPIAGLPALLLCASLYIKPKKLKFKEQMYGALVAGNVLILPILFFWLERKTFVLKNYLAGLVNFSWLNIKPTFPNSENWLLNLIYFINSNSGHFLFFILLGMGLAFLIKKGQQADWRTYLIVIGHIIALICAYFLIRPLAFNYLIDYERQNYANRLITIAGFIAIPLIIIPYYELAKRAKQLKKRTWLQGGLYLGLLFLIGANLYLSYPRKDNYYNSHGNSTSVGDLATVSWINQNANGQDYVVLTNQQISAAALAEFGFAKYYNTDIFYYPIPTGGPLYNVFMEMNQKPSKETALKASQITGAKIVYYIATNYWTASDKSKALAGNEASSSKTIGENTVYIYEIK